MDHNKLVEHLLSNSTWRGVILIVTAIGVIIADDVQQMGVILGAGLSLVGAINVIRTP